MFDRQGRRKYLNGRERAAFLRVAHDEADALRRAFCLVLFHTGCRISEGLNLTAGRVDLSETALVFETLKRRKRGVFRAVLIPDSLVELLRPLVAGKESSGRMFGFSRASGFRLVKEVMTAAAITGGMASPKGLRHGFAIACIGKNIQLATVKKWMGHARLETTALYLDAMGDEERDFAKRLWNQEETS